MATSYWLDLFTPETWEVFQKQERKVSGFRNSLWHNASGVRPGDILLCYVTRVSRWVGVLRVVGAPYQDETRIWEEDIFPVRLPVEAEIMLTAECGVPMVDVRDHLSYFDAEKPDSWIGHVRGSLAKEAPKDATIIIEALKLAQQSPVRRPVPLRRGTKDVTVYATDTTVITVPSDDEPTTQPESGVTHEEIQWTLLKLGEDMGYDIWIARNDRSRLYKGKPFSE